jgi:uncharacterized membrane protein YvlD (DUF360 family)
MKGKPIRTVLKMLIRFFVLWFIDTLSLWATAAILPGINLMPQTAAPPLVVAAGAAFLLSIVNLVLRPLILLLALPLGPLVMFLVGFLANAVALLITSRLLPALEVDGLFSALIGGIVLAAINTIVTGILTLEDDDSFYHRVVARLAKRQTFAGASEPGRGLLMIEIDGLSYWHLKKALDEGILPTLSEMMKEEGYQLSRVDCGLPSQTSACQAGILFGDNYDIPAFRWYDKDRQKLMVSGTDAAEINQRYAKGNGLLRGGSSINNMMAGDAEKAVLTLATLRSGSDEEKKRRAQDIYLLMVNPYFLMRTIALMLGDALLELYQGWRQKVQKGEPRMNRLHRAYPLLRAATTVFMRDVESYLAVLDVIRGSPAIYLTFPGYDEVAHHSGPWTKDAFNILKRYDHTLSRIREMVRRKAARPYELILLSDHGQSQGWTFKQRYGYDLKEFIEQHLPQGTSVFNTMGGDDGSIAMAAVSGELDNVQQQGMGGRVGSAVVRQGAQAARQGAARQAAPGAAKAAQVTVCGSGNLGVVYFDLYPRKVTRNELNAAYPGMIDAVVGHEGVGFVVAYEDDGTPVVYGKGGCRNLKTGEVVGLDPLTPYGDPGLRAEQVRRVAEFPHAPDLLVMSTVYPDGSVAAMEELIGNHGGLGGEQTDAFLFHPADMVVPETKNSADVFAILNARRGLPELPPRAAVETVKERDEWTPANLGKGLGQIGRWLGLAARAAVLDRDAYREVVRDPAMTGPALLIVMLASLLVTLAVAPEPSVVGWLVRLGVSFMATAVIFAAGRLLGRKGSFTTTFRGVGFAQAVYVLGLLAFIPALAPVVRLVVSIVSFVGVWMGAAEAHDLHGWRGLVFPVMFLVVMVAGVVALLALLAGAQFTLSTLGVELGLSQ